MAPTKNQAANNIMATLQAAVAAAPDVSKEIAAIEAAQATFDTIQQKAREAHGTNYAAELNRTHAALVTAQARHDVGRCSAEDLAEAKAAYADAQEKANLAPGRRAVLLDELERSREAIQDAVSALDDAQQDWAGNVDEIARKAEKLALELLVSASHALRIADPERHQVYAMQILEALPQYSGNFAGGGATQVLSEVAEPEQTLLASTVRRRAMRSLEYLPDSDRMSASQAENREAQLAPDAIEKARQAALASANKGHKIPIVSTPPQVGDAAPGVVFAANSVKTAPYTQF